MEQGTGKTLPTIAMIGKRNKEDGVKRVLIICPLSVMSEWKYQLEGHADFNYDVSLLRGKLDDRRRTLIATKKANELQIILINYESTWRMHKELRKWKPCMVIADESQKIKNSKAKQTKAVIDIGRVAKYRMILTGTPITKSPLDLFAQYKFLDPTIFGVSFYKFRKKYAIMGGYGGYEIIKYKGLDDLSKRAYKIAFRVTKKEALDLPEEVYQRVYSELEPKAMAAYKEMKKKAILKLGSSKVTAPIVLTQLLRLQQITGGFIKDEEGELHNISRAKIKALVEVLEDLLYEGKKVVIFARFTAEIKAIAEELEKLLGDEYCIMTGKTKQEQREVIIREFQVKPSVRVLLTQIAVGGVGITLTAADTAIFYSLDFSLTNYEQAKARIHRIGQENKVTYINLIAEKTVDHKILNKLKAKQDLSRMVIDELREILEDGGNEMTRISSKEVRDQVFKATDEHVKQDDEDLVDVLDDMEVELKSKIKTKKKKKATPKEEKAFTDNSQIITLKQLAHQLGIEGRVLRKYLRKKYGGANGRWEWAEGTEETDKLIRKAKKHFNKE